MTGIDIALCGLYLVVTLVIGGLVGRRQRSTEDYFLAGRGMRWWPVAISLFASLFSAISYIAMPAEAYNFGCTMLVCGLVSVLALPVMLFVFLRFFHAMRLFTINEYLERRFSVRIRLINSLFFICVRLTYLGVCCMRRPCCWIVRWAGRRGCPSSWSAFSAPSTPAWAAWKRWSGRM